MGPAFTKNGLAYVVWVRKGAARGEACTEHHEVLHALGWDHDDTRRDMTTDGAICGWHIPIPAGTLVVRLYERADHL